MESGVWSLEPNAHVGLFSQLMAKVDNNVRLIVRIFESSQGKVWFYSQISVFVAAAWLRGKMLSLVLSERFGDSKTEKSWLMALTLLEFIVVEKLSRNMTPEHAQFEVVF